MTLRILDKYRPLWAPEGVGGGAPQAPALVADQLADASVGDTDSSNGDSFGGLDQDHFESGDDVVILQEGKPVDPAGAPAMAAPPVVDPTKSAVPATPVPAPGAQATPPVQAPTPAAQQVASQEQAAQAPASDPVGPQGLVEQLAQHREEVIGALAADRFKLTPAEAEALENDAVGAIPRIMARTYQEAVSSALLHIQNFVPRMVQEQIQVMSRQREAEDAFYSSNKSLERGKHHNDVMQFARLFRQHNPQITGPELMALVASAVVAKHGIPQQAAAQQQLPQHAVPAFVPAPSSAAVRVLPEGEHPFAGLGQDHE